MKIFLVFFLFFFAGCTASGDWLTLQLTTLKPEGVYKSCNTIPIAVKIENMSDTRIEYYTSSSSILFTKPDRSVLPVGYEISNFAFLELVVEIATTGPVLIATSGYIIDPETSVIIKPGQSIIDKKVIPKDFPYAGLEEYRLKSRIRIKDKIVAESGWVNVCIVK